jgi:ABC-type dipeptide/oligopeptide/nickel transport system ATPase component
MKQRALIASVMVAQPTFVIADEPTASLDRVTERQIVSLMRQLRAERQIGLMVITHDIAVVTDLCDDVAVLYRGRLVEHGPVTTVLSEPEHPYTQGLILASRRERNENGRLVTVPHVQEGVQPSPSTQPRR